MTINAWKTSFEGLNKPSKVLSGTADSFQGTSLWPYANGQDDPYWSGGSNPQFYQWEVIFTVNEKQHGSHLTRTPFKFDAQDIEVGDFVAGAADGKVCQIMSITSKTNNTITAIVEDRLRYNTFRDPTGFGLFGTPGPVIFFQINELGYPMLDPLPPEGAADFFSNVASRFQYLNPLTNYLLEQTNNGFETGDAICIEDGAFVLSDSDNVTKFIGTVLHPGPGPDQFILKPANGIIDFVPGLPGSVGDYLYPSIDGSGDLTTSDQSRRPIFMKIADAIPCITTGTGIDPQGVDGDIYEFNRVQITVFGSGSGTYNIDDAVSAINSLTNDHKITAVKVGAATEVISDVAGQGSAYGIVAGYTPFSASINGVAVNFTTTTSGSAVYGDPAVADANDMVKDINATGITDIVASVVNGSEIKIRNNGGGAITIVNITADANGNNFAGTNSISSLPENTAANTSTYALRLTREDGGPLTIRDIQGSFLTDSGVISGQNGRYALGLYIEQGLRSSSITVVADITARDALYPLVGDQTYVIDDGNGEWAMFMFDGSVWTRVGNKRSDETDARTLVLDVDLSTATTGTQTIGYISSDRTVVSVRVLVTSPASSDAEVTVGTSTNTAEFFESRDAILSQSGQYTTDPEYRTSDYTEVVADITNPTPGAGQFTVILTYV
jgi:hypothetical protein